VHDIEVKVVGIAVIRRVLEFGIIVTLDGQLNHPSELVRADRGSQPQDPVWQEVVGKRLSPLIS
jgi:hypothetical protein